MSLSPLVPVTPTHAVGAEDDPLLRLAQQVLPANPASLYETLRFSQREFQCSLTGRELELLQRVFDGYALSRHERRKLVKLMRRWPPLRAVARETGAWR